MTAKKLNIIGPYTPEHPGPFCTRDGRAARVVCRDMKNENHIVTIIEMHEDEETVIVYREGGRFSQYNPSHHLDLMNDEEVPVAREFWVNEYASGWGQLHDSHDEAVRQGQGSDHIRTIHVREVLPGDEE